MNNPKNRVVVGLSGGVDSSVSAALLVEQGYDVVGLFMKNWEEDDSDSYCAAAEDARDAEKICTRLGIELHKVNFAFEYWQRVFEDFLQDYQDGLTPNPDILCNREIKFREFHNHAKRLGADYIATGHYARLDHHNGETRLLKGIDPQKDQSYFLHSVDETALSNTLFPVGELTKSEVRHLAEKLAFENSGKKDSTGICFIGERKFRDFLKSYLKPNPGPIVEIDGNEIGRHEGLMYYTIGQRHGLGIGGPGEPWYVSGKATQSNTLTVVQGHDHPALMSTKVFADHCRWIGPPPADNEPLSAKTRYRQKDAACTVTLSGETLAASFKTPQRAATPGQYIVIYREDVCLGGAVIQGSK